MRETYSLLRNAYWAIALIIGLIGSVQAQPSAFVTIEPFPGVTLDVPGDWRISTAAEIQQVITATEAMQGSNSGIPRQDEVIALRPPLEANGIGLLLMVRPPVLTQAQLMQASQAELQDFARGLAQASVQGFEPMGFRLVGISEPSKTVVGDKIGLAFSVQVAAADGSSVFFEHLLVPAVNRVLWLQVSYSETSPILYKPILERAWKSFQVRDASADDQQAQLQKRLHKVQF